MLAGMSTDYYVRLEQGRERHPSVQVVDALARALRLDQDAVAHLQQLARPVPGRRPAARRERVSPNLVRMMEAWTFTPAVILGRRLNVLADNALGRALFDEHTYSRDPGKGGHDHGTGLGLPVLRVHQNLEKHFERFCADPYVRSRRFP